MPPVKVYWYDGFHGEQAEEASKSEEKSMGARRAYLPPLLRGTCRPSIRSEKFEGNGTLYVGEKGILYTGCYGGNMHILPKAKMDEITQPPKTLPRPKGSFADFLSAVREGRTDTAASFEYGARLTEFILLGNLAQHAGKGKRSSGTARR